MNKPLIFTAALMSAALVAGAAVDADNIYNRLFPEVKIVEYREPRGREAPPIKGILADKVGETALMRTGYTPGGKPILRWAHYTKLKKEI